MKDKIWYLYIAKCADGCLYTGITTNPKRREKEHNRNNLRGASSLRGKRPVKIIYTEKYPSRSKATKREASIKNWKRSYKIRLVEKSKN